MPEPLSDLLTEYVDEQSPQQAPPFGTVEREAGRRKRRRAVSTVAAVVVLAAGTAAVTTNLPGAEEPAAPTTTPTTGLLDDGPPPAQFRYGTTMLVLQREVPVTAVRPAQGNPSVLVVETAREAAAGRCLPHTMVRILSQDAARVRIAAYRYAPAPDQPEGPECPRSQAGPVRIHLDLRSALAGRTVLAGSTGDRVVLN